MSKFVLRRRWDSCAQKHHFPNAPWVVFTIQNGGCLEDKFRQICKRNSCSLMSDIRKQPGSKVSNSTDFRSFNFDINNFEIAGQKRKNVFQTNHIVLASTQTSCSRNLLFSSVFLSETSLKRTMQTLKKQIQSSQSLLENVVEFFPRCMQDMVRTKFMQQSAIPIYNLFRKCATKFQVLHIPRIARYSQYIPEYGQS